MRLRRITLSGFKTFAARSEVIFDSGITAIVGPNGSGKSNLVDAVRWALGETNARELRGQRMDEVIYAGGGGRQRMGLAQVELVIDNEEGSLPSDDPEVSVSRRVARGDRDTEFRINGDHARLRDLERLLLVAPSLEFHPSTETLLEFFSPAIEVERVGIGVEWRKGLQVMFRLTGSERPR